MPEHTVALYAIGRGTDLERSRARLAEVLGAGVVGEPDDAGIVEIRVDAEDQEAALQRVWDAVAAAGADDHLAFAEHPDVPEHWRRRDGGGSPGAAA